jgi:hypothetical protein
MSDGRRSLLRQPCEAEHGDEDGRHRERLPRQQRGENHHA